MESQLLPQLIHLIGQKYLLQINIDSLEDKLVQFDEYLDTTHDFPTAVFETIQREWHHLLDQHQYFTDEMELIQQGLARAQKEMDEIFLLATNEECFCAKC